MGAACSKRKATQDVLLAAPPSELLSCGDALRELVLDNGDDTCTFLSCRQLEPERYTIYAAAFSDIGESSLYVVVGRLPSGGLEEFLVLDKTGSGSEFVLKMAQCSIMMTPLTPAACIEFCFEEEPHKWYLAQVSSDAVEYYKQEKFGIWKGMFAKPDCEASMRRLLQMGPITKIFDPVIFPTPVHLQDSYQVRNEDTGKMVKLPHPVAGLRKWYPSTAAYVSIDPHLDGAPSEAEKGAYWNNLIDELKTQHGIDYIESLMNSK